MGEVLTALFGVGVVCLVLGFWVGWVECEYHERLKSALDEIFPIHSKED